MFTQISMILALETSSSLCAVCLLEPSAGEVLAEISNDIGRGHAERLMDDVTEALRLAGVGYADLTVIAAGIGPGSFTGIRVAVAAARGFGLALKIPVLGVTSLQAIALQAKEYAANTDILVVQDAGREELHVQLFDSNALPLRGPKAMVLAEFPQEMSGLNALIAGSGIQILDALSLPKGLRLHVNPLTPTAQSVARAARNPAMTMAAKPLYLRAPDAKAQTGFAIARTPS